VKAPSRVRPTGRHDRDSGLAREIRQRHDQADRLTHSPTVSVGIIRRSWFARPSPIAALLLLASEQRRYSATMVKDRPEPPPAPDSSGLSLDELSQAFATLLGDKDPAALGRGLSQETEVVPAAAPPAAATQESDQQGFLSPRALVEAALFVGRPDNLPITSEQIAGLSRQLSSQEIEEQISLLNAHYAENGCPYEIVAEEGGYRLSLRPEFAPLRARVQGRNRAARLSPAAIEVLSLVAYNEPLSADQVTQLRGTPSGHILSNLVRRQLLRLERAETKPRQVRYFTTGKFLKLFHLKSLQDLPRSDDLARE
jgi:segregation and condensation protein B